MRDDTPRERVKQARSLRREMTNAEVLLWRALRNRGLDGLKFRRQVPIGPFIADFACVDRRLIVELDGRPHDEPEQQLHDRKRDAWFETSGWRVLRLLNERVTGGVALDDIRQALRL